MTWINGLSRVDSLMLLVPNVHVGNRFRDAPASLITTDQGIDRIEPGLLLVPNVHVGNRFRDAPASLITSGNFLVPTRRRGNAFSTRQRRYMPTNTGRRRAQNRF